MFVRIKVMKGNIQKIKKEKKEKLIFDYYGFTKAEEKEYPVVVKILKQITPERVEKEIKEVEKVEIPLELQEWIKEYKKVGERKEFTWKLFLKARQEIDYLSVPKIYQKSLQEIKLLLTIFVVLLDDVVDQDRNQKLLNELLKIPFNKKYIEADRLNEKEKEYLKFSIKVWHRMNLLMTGYPKYKEFKSIFEYDIKQMLNAMEYNNLVNKNYCLINRTEYWLYSPHTLQFIITAVFDLMCFSKFNIYKLSVIRELVWNAQKMTRIGNCVSTWEREIEESDFTGGVFVYAISSEILSPKEIMHPNKSKIIKKIKESKIENELLKEWQNCYRNIFNLRKKIKIVNIQNFLYALENLLIFEMISRKYK